MSSKDGNPPRLTARQLWKRVTVANLSSVYFLVGDDDWIREKCVDRLRELLTDKAGGAPQESRFQGLKEIDAALTAAGTATFFSPHQLILLGGIDKAKKENLGRLERYLKSPSDFTVFVVTLTKPRGGTVLARLVTSAGIQVSCDPLSANERLAWAQRRLSEESLEIDQDALALLVARSGSALRDLSQNAEKLVLRSEPGDRIDAAKVQDLVDDLREDTVFVLTDHIVEGRSREAVIQLRKMLRKGETPGGALRLLARHLRILAMILDARQMSPEDLADAAGISAYFLGNYRKQANQLSPEQIRNGLERLRRIDYFGKQGLLDDGPALEMNLGVLFEEPGPRPRGPR